MPSLKPCLLIAVAVLAYVAVPAAAAEDTPTGPSAEQIAKWIEQLDAEGFADREAATRKLTAAGKAAIPALAKAATDDSVEASSRSLQLLRKLLDSSDAATKAAAKEALGKIAAANHPTASARAEEAIRPPQPAPPAQPPGGIAIAVQSIGVKNVNGVKEITVTEGNKTVQINDDPQKGIKVTVTETDNAGNVTTRTVEAKDADGLKQQDKEAHELYKKYGQGNAGGAFNLQIIGGGIQGGGGRIQIQPGGGGIQIQPRAIPAMPRAIPAVPGGLRRMPQAQIILRQLQNVGRQLDRLPKETEQTEETKKALGQIEEELKRLSEQVKQRIAGEEEKPEEGAGEGEEASEDG